MPPLNEEQEGIDGFDEDLFDPASPATEGTTDGQEAPEAPEPPEGTEQAPEAPPAATEGTEQAPAAPEAKPDPGFVPLSVVLDERERRQAAERRAQELSEKLKPLGLPEPPDPEKDLQGYLRHVQATQQLAIINERMNFSERFAREKHGDEAVNEAFEWAMASMEKDENLARAIVNDTDPYGRAVKEFQAQQRMKAISSDDEWNQFQAWKAAQAAGEAPPAGGSTEAPASAKPAAPAAPKKTAPVSIAASPSASGPQGPTDSRDGFAAEFE